MTVKEAIAILNGFSPDSVLSLDINEPTCDDGTCFEPVSHYPYEMFETDVCVCHSPKGTKDCSKEVKILYSSNS